jgi:UDP-glucose 4-epimerase
MAEDSGRRILLTGIAGALAGRLAARLEAEERVEYLAGMDLREPSLPLSRGEFIRADLRNPIVAKVIDSTEVDTVVHLDVAAGPSRAGSRSPGHQLNVTGTLQLLAAAQQAARLRKLVLRSTTAVYGSSHTDPALFSEHVAPGAAPRSAYSKDAVEIEAVTRAFGRRRDDVVVSILRFATLISGSADSPLAPT